MNTEKLKTLLEDIRGSRITVAEGMARLKDLSYVDLGCAKLDTHRELRVGYPEVIFCPGKTAEQVKTIFQAMFERNTNILATRAGEALFAEIRQTCPEAVYHPLSGAITVKRIRMETPDSYIAVANFSGIAWRESSMSAWPASIACSTNSI